MQRRRAMRATNASGGMWCSLARFRSALHAALPCVALLALTSACSTPTSTTQVMSAEVPAHTKLRSVLVVGLGPGGVDRRELEGKLAEGLTARGLLAKPSYELFPLKTPDQDEAREVGREAGFDGIVMARVRLVETRKRYVPATETYFAGFEGGWYTRSSPGHYVNDEIAEFDTSVWDTKDGKKLWAATTRTVNPAQTIGFTGSFTQDVLGEMQKAGLVPGEKPRL